VEAAQVLVSAAPAPDAADSRATADPPSSAADTTGTTTDTPATAPTTGLGLDDIIEMDSVTPSGHRRRRSSLINPAGASNSRHRSPLSRSQSSRSPVHVDDDDKIVEESSDDGSLQPGEVDETDVPDEDLHDDEETGLTGKDKRRKRRRRRRNQLLDQRIAKDDDISPEEKQEADRNVAKSLVVNGVLIGLWYFFSLLISLVRHFFFPHPAAWCLHRQAANLSRSHTSTTNGCFHPTSSTSASPCSPPPCTSSCSLPSRH
jgi:solute carrier family 35 protein C2